MYKSMKVLAFIAVLVLFTMVFAAMASADIVSKSDGAHSSVTIYVPDNYAKIQWAVDSASAGDTIIVKDGIYKENVDVNVNNLTIQTQNGSPSTIVQAVNPEDAVFRITANHVNIRGGGGGG